MPLFSCSFHFSFSFFFFFDLALTFSNILFLYNFRSILPSHTTAQQLCLSERPLIPHQISRTQPDAGFRTRLWQHNNPRRCLWLGKHQHRHVETFRTVSRVYELILNLLKQLNFIVAGTVYSILFLPRKLRYGLLVR